MKAVLNDIVFAGLTGSVSLTAGLPNKRVLVQIVLFYHLYFIIHIFIYKYMQYIDVNTRILDGLQLHDYVM